MTPEKFFEDPKIIKEMSDYVEMMKMNDVDALRTVITVMVAEIFTIRSILTYFHIDQPEFDALRDEPLRILNRLIEPDEGEG